MSGLTITNTKFIHNSCFTGKAEFSGLLCNNDIKKSFSLLLKIDEGNQEGDLLPYEIRESVFTNDNKLIASEKEFIIDYLFNYFSDLIEDTFVNNGVI